ncbi:hypothetical protein K438DRAFT_1940102 [Mycena galopus ATCC 62051]|nr:hypothetical protein K438DRAFT_1940102 [Mycena galopus ATCC 62051]
MPGFMPQAPAEIIEIDDSDDEAPTISKEPRKEAGNFNTFSDFESDDEDQNELEQKPLISPSTDIKADFEDALQNGFEFDGTFAFSERYGIGAAPNPCLNIDGLGPIGLPLSQREAITIIAACVPVSTGLSGDANASGIWEMSPEKVHFDNPDWDVWIQETAGEAATEALDAYSGASPIFTLKKLVLHEPGSHTSHFKEPISEDEAETKIGDFVAILPGLFLGAQLQLSYGGQTKSLDLAHQSGLSTSIVAAYSGVEHILAGVTSGYRLSLLYDIVQPITHAEDRPTLPEMQGAAQKLRNIMLSWKQDASGAAPDYLACLLQHKYAQSLNFSAKSLTGADALLVSHLHALARQLKFRLYLAHVQGVVTTGAEARSYRRNEGRYGWSSDEECDMSDIDESDFVDDGEEEESLCVAQVVDLCGMPVNVDLDFGDDDLLGSGSVTGGNPDRTTFEREERTTATRTKIYNRTVLLIWPKNNDLDLSVAIGDIYDYAFGALESSLTDVPTKREATRRKDPKLLKAVQVLRESADRWNDAEIFLRAMRACGVDNNIDVMGVEGFVSAYQAFGWDALKGFCRDVIKTDGSNSRRNALLARLTKMGEEEDDEEVSMWCAEQAERVLGSLGKVDAAQIPWLASVGLVRGGEFLRDVIFPQLKAQKLGTSFWIHFIPRLQQNLEDVSMPSPQVVSGLIAQSVSQIARHLPAFPVKSIKTPYGVHHQEGNSEAILEVVKLCVETENEALCSNIFAKMRDAVRAGSFNADFPPWEYYAKLASSLMQYTQSASGLDATFQPFFLDVVDSMISPAQKNSDGRVTTRCPLSENHRATIMRVARKAGGISVLQQRFKADTLKGHRCSTLQALTRSVMAEFSAQMRDPVGFQACGEVIITVVHSAIRAFDTSSLVQQRGQKIAPSQQMIDMVNFCFQVGAQRQCQYLLDRFLAPPTESTTAQYASRVLAPFLPVLRQYLAGKNLELNTEPYKTFAVAVVKLFAEQVMTAKPREIVPVSQLQGIGCQGCQECRALKEFFLSERTTLSFQTVGNIRLHLERQLAITRAWGVSWETIKTRSPHTLKIKKPAAMAALGQWAGNSLAGKKLLLNLGDPAAQTGILGADYARVHARITGANDVVMPLGNTNRTINAPKRAATAALPAKPAKKTRTL